MAINTEVVSKTYSGIVVNVPLSVDMPLFAKADLVVTYGDTRLLALQDTDYSIVLSEPTFESFTFTPTPSLLTKIGVGTNVVYLTRTLDYKSDLTEADTFFRAKLVKAIDSVMMRFQQVVGRLKTGVDHNITISTAGPSGGEDGDIWLKVP